MTAAVLNVTLAIQTAIPVLVSVRPFVLPMAISLGVVVVALASWLVRQRKVAKFEATTLAGLGIAAFLIAASNGVRFQYQRHQVLAAGEDGAALGRHFIVGYSDLNDVAMLAARGLIGGVYISRKIARTRSAAELAMEIATLQTIRRNAGIPPLLIAADQEGGSVSHLTPPLAPQPPLASLVSNGCTEGDLESRARAYGITQGKGLAELGVTLNFGPVVDLLTRDRQPVMDTHTRLDKRSISGDPAIVTRVARAYGEGLMSQGVRPTLKHFPGLGRVGVDTHHSLGRIDDPIEDLRLSDWKPFRSLVESGVAIMVGHVVVAVVDSERPASLSPRVINGLLRRDWGFDGLVVTDDLNMGAVYRLGVGEAAVAALSAGADLVLVSYDPDQYFAAMSKAISAYRNGSLKSALLDSSRRRLDRALKWQSYEQDRSMREIIAISR